MAVKLADAVAYLKTDDAGLRSGLDDAERRTGAWSTILGGALLGVGLKITDSVVGAMRGAVATLGESIGLASDLSETISKTGQIFGDASSEILAWSDTAAAELGQTKQQALDAAATFGIFGKAAGLSGTDLAGFSTGLSGLASDLASFNNTSPEQAIEAIGAALRGEAEPLRAYGVLLDDASLKNAAFAMGLTTSATETLTQQDKILAAQKVIFDQTQVQQGDFARTSDGLANQQRILSAQWTDFKTSIDTIFLPVVTEAVGAINNMVQTVMPGIKDFLETSLIPAFEGAARALGNLFEWIGELVGGFKGAADDAGTWADDLGRVWRGSADNINANTTAILDNLSVFASWFGGEEANGVMGWMANVLAALVAFSEATSRQVLLFTTSIRIMGEGLQALFAGDFQKAFEADVAAQALLSGVGIDKMLLDMRETFKRTRDQLRAELIEEQRDTSSPIYGPQMVQKFTTYVPIVINATGDPAAIAAAAQRGVQQALRQAGIQ